MIRVRICTNRWRCHSSCRRSRFSGPGTQICGKLFSRNSRSSSRASSRSNFCFFTRLALISAGSPIHSAKPNSASSRSNQRECSFHPYPHIKSSLLQVSIEFLCLSITVVQFLFTTLTGLFHKKCNRLKARVVIYAYQHHVRLLPSEPMVVMQPKCTVEGADIVMQSCTG